MDREEDENMENEENNNNNNDEDFSQELRQFVRALGHERINTQNMNTRELRYAFLIGSLSYLSSNEHYCLHLPIYIQIPYSFGSLTTRGGRTATCRVNYCLVLVLCILSTLSLEK